MSFVRESARGEPCTMQIPGVCSLDWDTTVMAHINFADVNGMGMKAPDFPYGIYCCSWCHDVIDKRSKGPDWYTHDMLWQDIARAIARTHNRMLINGTLKKIVEKGL